MPSMSHAFIKPHASTKRVHSLMQELRAAGCSFLLSQQEDRIDFDVSTCAAAWVAEGGIGRVFSRYTDVIIWSAEFYDSHPPIHPAGRA